MIRKRKLILSTLTALALGGFVYPASTALAVCNRTGGSSADDIYQCTNPPDVDGLNMGSGNDRVVINPDTTVSGGGTTVDAGSGSDYVENRGTINARYDGIHGRDGVNDTILNYGTVTAGDDGIWCTPRSGQTCTIRNYGTVKSINETLDISNSGGRMVVFNQGRLEGGQEVMHFHGAGTYDVENRGTIQSGRSCIETYLGTVVVRNYGTLYTTGSGQMPILLYTAADNIVNTGTIRSARYIAVYTHGGNDVLNNMGTIESTNTSSSYATVNMGPGSDSLTTSGNIRELGASYASVFMGDGTDTLTIRGGQINKRVEGDGGSDLLVFELTGSSSEVSAFRTRVNSQSPANGSATWRGNTYTWREFESIRLTLTTADLSPDQIFSAMLGMLNHN